MIYLELFWGFLTVGAFAFGGAYAAIPLIREVVLSYGWLSDDMLAVMISVSESTPGPMMVYLATYVGAERAGFWGALLATTAVMLPSFAVTLLIMAVLKNAMKNRFVKGALRGLKPCIIGIILAIGAYMALQNCGLTSIPFVIDMKSVFVTIALVVLYYGAWAVSKKKPSPILLILLSAGIGAAVF